MLEQPEPPRQLLAEAAKAIWRNGLARILLLILLAFEVYNNAILPAIRGAYQTMRTKAETEAATAKFLDPKVLARCENDGHDLDTCRKIIDRYY